VGRRLLTGNSGYAYQLVRIACHKFTLRDVIPQALEAAACNGRRRYGAGLRQLQGMGPSKFVLSVDKHNEF